MQVARVILLLQPAMYMPIIIKTVQRYLLRLLEELVLRINSEN